MKKLATLLALILALTCLTGLSFAEETPEGAADELYEDAFPEWNPDAPALNALIDYIEAVTDEASPDYIPPVDRIAVFDMDGTVYGELFPTYLEYYILAWRILKDPSIQPDEEMLAVGRTLRDCALDNSFPSDMPMQHAIQAARAYAGLTLPEFADFVTRILIRDVDGFEGMTYANTFYLPMIEVVEYLQENGFKVYVCSGSDRFLCRTFIEGVLDIPYEQIIGMDVDVEATNEDGADGLKYVYTREDSIIRTDRLLIKNLKMNKVKAIVKEIGRQPVLSFGNSSGDVSMHNYTIFNNRYKSAAFMLIADDEERDYGNTEKVQPLKEKWEESGYHVISMKDDFRTIYGDDVVKTGSFHWLEEFADREETDGEAEPEQAVEEAEPEAAEEGTQYQYVMYLGTNDKDTNKPVFTQAGALEQAKAILLKRFGGYTIMEANGGWIDEGKEYQEYTLVIYLSDTNIEAVHAAADEMTEVFRQSSVLIQENPTRTEFYAPGA